MAAHGAVVKNGEFFLTPIIAAALFGANPNPLLFFAGALLWTFIEYAVHRGLHVTKSRAHHHHHADPQDEPGAIFWPFWLGLLFAVWLAPMGLCAGLVAGYSWFIYVHHACHFDASTVMPELLSHHDKHHHAHPGANFGVSTRLWDRLFRTAR